MAEDEATEDTDADAADETTAADDEALDTTAAAAEEEEEEEDEGADPLAYGTGVSPSLVHPVLAVNSLGQVTASHSTVGLSAPSNQSHLKSQPGCSALGNVEHVSLLIPPYCAPQPPAGAPHSAVQPL